MTENRLKEIDERILKLKQLKKISFRKNLLEDVSVLKGMQSAAVLSELVLYDNLIKRMPSLENYRALEKLDVSYNKIRSMEPVEQVSTSVEHLYLAANKISEVTGGLSKLVNLTLLELGSNRIRKMQHFEALANLQELWLGRNKIGTIECLSNLKMLRRLSIQNNRLRVIEGLDSCVNLEELYLSFNGITRINGLSKLTKLKILDFGNNQIEKIEGLETQEMLEDLWLNDNQVGTLGGLESVRGTLKCIYLENNPVEKSQDFKTEIMQMLPHLEQLDATEI